MSTKNKLWIFIVLLGLVLVGISILMFNGYIEVPIISTFDEYPMLVTGFFMAGGFILIVKGFYMRKEAMNKEKYEDEDDE